MLPFAAMVLPSGATLAASLGYGVLSALIPVVNAELYIAAAAAIVARAQQPAMVCVFTAGTMVGKTALYIVSERLMRSRSAKTQAAVNVWIDRLHERRRIVWPVVLASAVVGLPPMYPVTLAAGMLRIGVVGFFVVGFAGRFVRFSVITWAANSWVATWL